MLELFQIGGYINYVTLLFLYLFIIIYSSCPNKYLSLIPSLHIEIFIVHLPYARKVHFGKNILYAIIFYNIIRAFILPYLIIRLPTLYIYRERDIEHVHD